MILNLKHFFTSFFSFIVFLILFTFFMSKIIKKHISIRVWSVQHSNAGRNIQQLLVSLLLLFCHLVEIVVFGVNLAKSFEPWLLELTSLSSIFLFLLFPFLMLVIISENNSVSERQVIHF